MLVCTAFSAVSQILLKQSANQEHESILKEYLNWRVITAYLIFGAVLLVNTYAYTQVELKYGLVLKEKITRGKLIGNLLIVAGVLIYTMP